MTDEALEQRLRRHYETRRAEDLEHIPSFRGMFEIAETRCDGRRRAALVAACMVPVAAALAVVWLGLPWQSGTVPVPAESQLVAELTSTTRWRAPSDRWLETPDTPAYAGWPKLGERRSLLEPPPLP